MRPHGPEVRRRQLRSRRGPGQDAVAWAQVERYGIVIVILLVIAFFGGIFYLKFAPKINDRLDGGPFSGTVNIYSAPRSVAVGDALTEDEIVARLRRARRPGRSRASAPACRA